MLEFVTLVSLIATYKQLKTGRESKDQAEFMSWLDHHKFEELRLKISESEDLSRQLHELLARDTSEIIAKLEIIENAVVTISKKMEGFEKLAELYSTERAISEQSLAILRDLEKTYNGSAILFEYMGEFSLVPIPDGQGNIYPVENRYFTEDLQTLVELGWLLEIGETQQGKPRLQVTRAGSEALKQLQG